MNRLTTNTQLRKWLMLMLVGVSAWGDRAIWAAWRSTQMRFRSLRMPLTMALACLCLAACARNALDDVYESSLELSMDVRRQESEEYRRWMAEDERWKRGELGPDAARPTRPGITYNQEMDVLRMRLMERELIAFLGAKCADQATDCVLKELEQLGFSCTNATVASCTLLNTARGKYDAPHKRIRERHAWTVTVAPPPVSPPIQAQVEIVPSAP